MGSGLLHHWITSLLSPANKKTDQSPSNSQAGIDAVAHATLDREKLILHTRTAVVDTVAILQGAGGY